MATIIERFESLAECHQDVITASATQSDEVWFNTMNIYLSSFDQASKLMLKQYVKQRRG